VPGDDGHPPGIPEWPPYSAATDRLREWGSPIAVRQHFRAQHNSTC
jgi:hypothetical protein